MRSVPHGECRFEVLFSTHALKSRLGTLRSTLRIPYFGPDAKARAFGPPWMRGIELDIRAVADVVER